MKLKLGLSDKFDAAHYLPNYPGKCRNQHGHTWHVEIEVMGELDEADPNGMIADFKVIKELLKKEVNRYDHLLLNQIIENPTAEHLTQRIVSNLQNLDNNTTKLCMVKVKEGDGGYCKWELSLAPTYVGIDPGFVLEQEKEEPNDN
jgi:6-pyruvoyltetrahydropterin/6-carboxytetrahydropterin synthase